MGIFSGKTKEEVKVTEAAKTIKDVLSDEKSKKICLDAANYIHGKLKNWFTIDQLMNKTTYSKLEESLDIMNLLCLMELCYREEKLPGVIKYKITINDQDRLTLLYEEREEAQNKVEYLDKLIFDVTKRISN